MKRNNHPQFKRKLIPIALIAMALSGCESDITSLTGYDLEGSCEVVPEVEDNSPQPVFSNDPILDAEDLSAAISFDYGERITGTIPSPITGTGLTIANIVVTDKSIQELFVSGDLAEGKRIGAVFIQLDGVDEYFAIPISLEMASRISSDLPLTITLRGPFPIEGTDPEPDLIQAQIISNITVAAFIVDSDEEAPDVTTAFDGIDDDANWLLPDTARTITAENVGTGGITATLFWNTQTDIDLWMIEPDDHKIYWNDQNSSTGDGFLDFDNVTGYGPENIYFTDNIANGEYSVQVEYFAGAADGEPVTNWSVSVTACGSTRAFSGTLNVVKELDEVFSFTISDNCSIEEVPDEPKTPSALEEVIVCDPAVLDTLND